MNEENISQEGEEQDSEQDTRVKQEQNKQALDPRLKWYVVHTYSGSETKARSALQDRVEKHDMSHLIADIFVPTTKVEKLSDSGKKKIKEKTLYPGYILVKMIYNLETRHLVNGTPKISGFVGDSRNPKPISEQEALRLIAQELASEQAVTEVKATYEKGETVKIKEGAFANFSGTIDEVRYDKAKLRVLVSIFGRETPVEIDFNQAEKIV